MLGNQRDMPRVSARENSSQVLAKLPTMQIFLRSFLDAVRGACEMNLYIVGGVREPDASDLTDVRVSRRLVIGMNLEYPTPPTFFFLSPLGRVGQELSC
jgi:hypothetical protein